MTAGAPRKNYKIAYITDTTTYGGAERQILHLVRRLDPNRFDALVVCLGEAGPLAEKIQHAGTTVIGLDHPAGAAGKGPVRRFSAYARLMRLLMRFDPDIVQVMAEEGQVLARLAARTAGAPILIGSHRRHGVLSARRGFLARRASRAVDVVVTPTQALRAEVAQFERLDPARIHVIPNAVELAEVRGKERPADMLEPRFRLAVFSRLEAGRGIDTLIEAAARLAERQPDLDWLVFGTGSDPIPFLRHAQRLGVAERVQFRGECEDIGSVLAAVDLVVAPAIQGGQSAAVLEATTAGVACLAARNPSLEETFPDGKEVAWFEGGDVAGLAAAVDRLFTDHAERSRLAAAGRRLGTRFRPEEPVIAWHDLYAALITEAVARQR